MADGNTSLSPAVVTWPFIEKLEVTRWAAAALYVVLFILGVPGNLLILGVCRAKGVRTTTEVFIGALALADLFTCVLKFGDGIGTAISSYNNESVVYFLSTGLLYSTALLTTCIALYLAIFVFIYKQEEILATDVSIRRQRVNVTGNVGLLSTLTSPKGSTSTDKRLKTGNVGPRVLTVSTAAWVVDYSKGQDPSEGHDVPA